MLKSPTQILCTICARGGSKGVKGKNLRSLGDLSLIQISILQARKSGLFGAISVSSDSPEILAEAKRHGADNLISRPAVLASDTAGKIPAIRHCVESTEALNGSVFPIVVDLDVTSPLRLVSDIQGAVDLLQTSHAPNVITGMPARRSPYFNLVEEDAEGSIGLSKRPAQQILRRQDAPRCWDMNASIYVWRRDILLEQNSVFLPGTKLFEMPEDRSFDIDSELDFEFVQFLASKRKGFPE